MNALATPQGQSFTAHGMTFGLYRDIKGIETIHCESDGRVFLLDKKALKRFWPEFQNFFESTSGQWKAEERHGMLGKAREITHIVANQLYAHIVTEGIEVERLVNTKQSVSSPVRTIRNVSGSQHSKGLESITSLATQAVSLTRRAFNMATAAYNNLGAKNQSHMITRLALALILTDGAPSHQSSPDTKDNVGEIDQIVKIASSPARAHTAQARHWHGITDAQLARTNLDYSIKKINDPQLRGLIAEYTQTQYLQDAFKNTDVVETGRLWPIATAAGIEELWSNNEHRKFLINNGIGTRKEAMVMLILFAEMESYFGSELNNDLNKRVNGIWHVEDKTLMSIATGHFSASELGLNEQADAQSWDAFKQYYKKNEKKLMQRDNTADRNFTNNNVPESMSAMRDQIIKNGRYGLLSSKMVLMLHADNAARIIRTTALKKESFNQNPHYFYDMHVLGYGRFKALINLKDSDKPANYARWAAIKAQNTSVACSNKNATASNCVARTKLGLMNEFNYRFTVLPVDRLKSTTSSQTRVAVGWNIEPHLPALR